MMASKTFCFIVLSFFASETLALAADPDTDLVAFEGPKTTFCVDPKVVAIFQDRIDRCIGRSIAEEISYLKSSSVFHFQKSHELFAYQYFVETKDNPRRMNTCEGAHFEYVPFLPLSWKLDFPVGTECTAGGECPALPLSNEKCGASHMIKDILKYISYVKTERGLRMDEGVPRFIVTAAFNLKTLMGRGLSAAVRQGEEYELVSSFIESTALGHYERLTQCADILRKQWKYVAEMPYISVFAALAAHPLSTISATKYRSSLLRPARALASEYPRAKFFFSGRLRLWGSERVCSVRAALLQLLRRNDTAVIDIGSAQAEGSPIRSDVFYRALGGSDFCLTARADSHTSASFYEALAANCIPIVISDWFVFAYRWWIPYTKFVIRVSEIDFLSDPNSVLDHIRESYSTDIIVNMKKEMMKWQKYLVFPVLNRDSPLSLPLDMLLIELSTAAEEIKTLPSRNPKVKPGEIMRLGLTGPTVCWNPANCFPAVKPLRIEPSITDKRNHLCRHSNRLVGYYKIVYFMQCVRMFWTLRPGLMKPADSTISAEEKSFVNNFHNITAEGGSNKFEWDVYPNGQNGNTIDNSISADAPVFYVE